MEKIIPFLKKLAKHNNRDWFLENKKEYEAAKKQLLEFTGSLIKELGKEDPYVSNIEPKDCIFRINRDIRFSADKSPYKTNMGISINRGGKKSNFAGYYLHIEPGKSFVAGGSYMPEAEILKAIRQEIDYNLDEFNGILSTSAFKKTFGTLEQEWKIKTTPKGYDANNPAIEHLKLKCFIVSHDLTDEDVLNKNLLKKVSTSFKNMNPFLQFLNRAIAQV